MAFRLDAVPVGFQHLVVQMPQQTGWLTAGLELQFRVLVLAQGRI
jgi:hypothetical protein